MAPTIRDPSASLCVPAVLVAVGVYVLISSWSENLINISSCVDLSPIVVSVPKNTKCLSGVDTSMCLDAVGALFIIVALESVAFVAAEFHSKHSPSTIKQIALSPKLSIDHIPGSIIKSPDAASPHATKSDVSVSYTHLTLPTT